MGRRGEKLLEGARGRGADWDFGDLDGDQQSASLRIPSRPPRHHRHLPCNEGLIIFWLAAQFGWNCQSNIHHVPYLLDMPHLRPRSFAREHGGSGDGANYDDQHADDHRRVC